MLVLMVRYRPIQKHQFAINLGKIRLAMRRGVFWGSRVRHEISLWWRLEEYLEL